MYHIHPSIFSPTLVGENNKDRSLLPKLPFPLIDTSYEGFTASHLHWIGIKVTQPEKRDKLIDLAFLHESCHRFLAHMPFSLIKRCQIYSFFSLLLRVLDEGKEMIDVPFTFTQPSTELQMQWAEYDNLMQRSMIVEEVYAVRTSLIKAKKEGVIEDDALLDKIAVHYKQAYKEIVHELFPEDFTAFDLLAKNLGEDAAEALIRKALFTVHPDKTFVFFLTNFCQTDSHSPNGLRWTPAPLPSDRPTLSFDEAYNLFDDIIKAVDKDDSYFGRNSTIEDAANAMHLLKALAQEDGPFKFFFDLSHNNYLLSEYTDTALAFYKVGPVTALLHLSPISSHSKLIALF
jgi:hypothetical protein